MNLLDSYKKDLKSYKEIKEEIETIKNTIFEPLQVYSVIDKLNLVYYHINIYDKFYTIKAILEHKENSKAEKIIELYSLFELQQNRIVQNFVDKIDLSSLDENYRIYLQNVIKQGNKNRTYDKLYKESEALFHMVMENELNVNEKVDYLKKYVSLKEQMANILGYSTFLDYKLQEIGISKNLFNQLICLDVKKRKRKESEDNKSYSLKEAFKIIEEVSSSYLNQEIVKKLFNNLILNDKSFVLTSYQKEPAIFINFNGKLESVDRLFHELSHAYHYKLASENKIINYNPSQFISEMFSMFNEILFLDNREEKEREDVFNKIYNNFFVDAVQSLKLENYVHQNYKTLSIDSLSQFDQDFEKHILFLFNDYYDINYAFGFVEAILLAYKYVNKKVNKADIEKLLTVNGNLKISLVLENAKIPIHDKLLEDFLTILNQ